MIDGRRSQDSPVQPSPVIVRRVWCARTGINANQGLSFDLSQSFKSGQCGPASCNGLVKSCASPTREDEWYCGGGPSNPRMNKCTNGGYCRCNPYFGGADCTIKLDETFAIRMQNTPIPEQWQQPEEFISADECRGPLCCKKFGRTQDCDLGENAFEFFATRFIANPVAIVCVLLCKSELIFDGCRKTTQLEFLELQRVQSMFWRWPVHRP
jgi:hypothetical protein